jgi:hypothetical protein
VVQDGHFLKPKAFSGATDCGGIRKTMKYELSASPLVLQVSGTKDNSISLRSCRPNNAGRVDQRSPLPDPSACYVAGWRYPVDRKSSGLPEQRFRPSRP